MKRLMACLLTGVLAVLLLAGAGVYYFDPYFHYHAPDVSGDVWMDERYQAAGLLRTQTYDTVLMGTSLAANYQPSWVDEAFDAQTMQITLPNGSIDEFTTVLHYAMECQAVERVVMGLDANIVARDLTDDPDELPAYLYNNNPLDDLPYLWNKDILAKGVYAYQTKAAGDLTPLDEAYLWDYPFSKEQAIASYPRPDISGVTQSDDYYMANATAHLDTIIIWLETYPEVDFHFYMAPYSVLFWDKMDREGTTEAMLTMLQYTLEILLPYDNASVHFFMNDTYIIDNLNNYTDHIHTSTKVTSYMTTAIATDNCLVREENLARKVDALRQFVVNYDYESIFE